MDTPLTQGVCTFSSVSIEICLFSAFASVPAPDHKSHHKHHVWTSNTQCDCEGLGHHGAIPLLVIIWQIALWTYNNLPYKLKPHKQDSQQHISTVTGYSLHIESPTRCTFSYIFILKFLYSTCFEQIYRSSSGVYKALYMQLFVHIMLTVTSCLASSVGTGIGLQKSKDYWSVVLQYIQSIILRLPLSNTSSNWRGQAASHC